MTRRQALGWMIGAACVPLGCRGVQDSRIPLRLANWGGAGDDSDFYKLVQQVYADFERQNTTVRLRVEGTPGANEYVSKLLLDHVSRSMPDLVTLDASSAAVFIDNGTLLDLTPYIERDSFDLSAFYPNVVNVARRDGALYALPTDFTPMVMYVNRRMVEQAGAQLPRGKWSFDEFIALAKATTRPGQYGFEFTNWMPGWVMFPWNNGSDVLSPDGTRATGFLDSEKSIEAVQFLADLVQKHHVAPSLSQAASLGVDLFATGKAAMKVVGHWNMVTLKASKDIDVNDVEIVELPTQLDKSVTVMYEAGTAIGKTCRHPDLAWEYLKYFTSRAVQAPYNATGIAVSARRDVEESKLRALADPDPSRRHLAHLSERFQQIVPSARAPWGSKVEGYDRVEVIGQQAMDAILKNGVAVKTALQEAARQIDAEFAKR